MKSIKFFAVAALLAISSGAYAQFANTSSGGSSTSVKSNGWSSIWVEYNALTADFTKGFDDESVTAFSAGYSQAFPISAGTPLFLEVGLGAQYSKKSDLFDIDDQDLSFLSAKIPVNLIYEFDIPNSNIKIDPFVGLSMRFNITGKLKVNHGDDDLDLFDKDDMGGSKYTMKRLQPAWQIGVKARFGGGLTAGLSYGSDLSNIWEPYVSGVETKAKVSTFTVALGYVF